MFVSDFQITNLLQFHFSKIHFKFIIIYWLKFPKGEKPN